MLDNVVVEAGLSPVEALRSGSSIPADKFGLKDRGRVKEGLNADLLLVNGDPTKNIEDAVKIDSVWRNGHLLDRAKAKAFVDEAVQAKAEQAKEKAAKAAAQFTEISNKQ
jgi:adenine deaminase